MYCFTDWSLTGVCSVNATNAKGETPLKVAILNSNTIAVKALLESPAIDLHRSDSAGLTPILTAATVGNAEIIRMLLKKGADPSLADPSGSFPIHLTAMGGYTEACRILVEDGKSLVAARNEDRWTPLHLAVQGGHLETATYLCGAHAPVNASNADGVTPLLLSAFLNNNDMARLLIDNV